MDIYNNRPMSYESSKILLQYLEANVRFQLSNRAPSIRKMEKLVPMKIHTLEFFPFEIVVNKTRYKLDFSDGDVVTPGDVVIRYPFQADPFRANPPYEESLERQLKDLKWILAERSGQEVKPLDEHLQENVLVYQNPDLPDGFPLLMSRFSHVINQQLSDEHLQKRISELETTLAPFRCRRSGLPYTTRPYTTSIQLTVISPDGEFQIWRKPTVHPVQKTNFKLHEAQKQLADRLFGDRADNVCVKMFEVGSRPLHPLIIRYDFSIHPVMIVRLPPTFQIKVECLTVGPNAPMICDAIRDLVHESSYPLRRVECKSRGRLTLHPTIAGARELLFFFYGFNGIQELLLFQNQNIYMKFNCFTPDKHITLLRNWIENRREIGSSLIFLYIKEDKILDIFVRAKEHLNGFECGRRCVKIPMTNVSQIKVFYKPLREKENRFKMVIKVVGV